MTSIYSLGSLSIISFRFDMLSLIHIYSAAIALSKGILNEGQPAVDKYMDFLRKGCSEYSIDLLKGAGVDMTSKKPIEAAMEVFKGLLDKMENLTK